VGLVIGLGGPGPHFFEACGIRIDIGNCLGGTSYRTLGVAAAQIALDDLAGGLVVIDCPERTGDSADLAANADRIENFHGSGFPVHLYCFNGAGMQAPRFIALGAGVGYKAPFFVKGENLYAGLCGIEYSFILVGAGHFTL